MNRSLVSGLVAVMAVAWIGYCVVVLHHLVLAVGGATAITWVAAVLRRGDLERAAASAVAWLVVLAAVRTSRLELVVYAAVAAAIAYVAWDHFSRGGRPA